MKCVIRQLKPLRIFHFNFYSSYDMNMTFVRLQEFYESPKFRGKFFTLEEYMDWYAQTYSKGEELVGFAYLTKTYGMNIPGNIVEEFFGKFWRDFRDKEIWIHSILTNRFKIEFESDEVVNNKPFYIIGTFGQDKEALYHEILHALYYLVPEYKRAINKTIRQFRSLKLEKHLIKQGYSKSVLNDEAHAYALDGWSCQYVPTAKCKRLKKELKKVERKFKDMIPCVK